MATTKIHQERKFDLVQVVPFVGLCAECDAMTGAWEDTQITGCIVTHGTSDVATLQRNLHGPRLYLAQFCERHYQERLAYACQCCA